MAEGDQNIWSSRASASVGVELMGHEVLVLGMSAAWCGPMTVDHAVMADAIDLAPFALRWIGLKFPRLLR